MKKFFLLILLIILVNNNLSAATGCLRAGQVYRNNSAFSGWSNPIQDNCPSGALTSTQYAQVNSVSGTSCGIGFLGWGGSGVLVDYDIEFCPIDDYIPFIFIIAGGTASYFLRRNFFNS
jgi:hypothetical protein